MKNRRTWMFLLCGAGALAVAATAMQATGATGAQTPTAPAPSVSTASSPLPAGLPAGEIQSDVVRNGARVIVIKAAQPVEVTSPADGMRAYVDPTTGAFREATVDDIKAEAAAAASAAARTRLRTAVAAATSEPNTVVGGEQMLLDDSTLVYTVANKDADGTVAIDHAQGGRAAVKAVAQPAGKIRKEQRDDR